MTKKERAAEAVRLLEECYPDAVCSLEYEKPYELLISVRLAAQCTDARVNLVTPELFAKYPTLEALASATPEEIGECIKSCGLYKTKARDIVALSQKLIAEFGGVVPDTIEALLTLPGVGRIRITNLLGLTTTKDPLKTERELRACLPMEKANDFCHRLVLHGRAVCIARRPQCGACVMAPVCKHAQALKKAEQL